uniref:Uncharacterized protein n=1 Tax=Aliivibrio fischeri TaxID=668 RepID=H2ERS1_ALIFS|nr:hypothetical protein [Aliivibrio fischeri]AEY78088.1 hypothetical protein [Aliivibrio fischeri]
MIKKLFICIFALTYANYTLANLHSWSNSYTPTLQLYEHFTKNDNSTFAIGCGKSKENNFLTLKITSQKLTKAKGVLDFNVSIDGADSYELKDGFHPNNSTIMVTNKTTAKVDTRDQKRPHCRY